MRRKLLTLALVLVLLALPLIVRQLYFYRDGYERQDVPRPDLDDVQVPTPDKVTFEDRYVSPEAGMVLVDLAHDNRFQMSELNVLRARLSARDQRLEAAETVDALRRQLHQAKALIVISPGENWQPDEVQAVADFVEKGGRLLLVTDPTRYQPLYDDWDYLVGFDSDVNGINELAARFGLVFRPDYLYNTAENEGNFRNIRLTDLAEHPLTQGLDQVVFYATHSIASQELALIRASGQTRSSDSERAADLAVAVLAADGSVLALADLSFMTPPHNAVYDNDQLVANVADFLSGAIRSYQLVDFPHFFQDQVDLVYADDPLLDSDILAGGGRLQSHLADLDKELTVRQDEDPGHDTIFLGLYAFSQEVEPYLQAAGVTLLLTPTQTTVTTSTLTATLSIPTPTATMPAPTATPSTGAYLTATPPITLVQPLTDTLALTDSLNLTETTEITVPTLATPTVGRVEIASLGRMVITGTALLILQSEGEHQVLLVLANTEAGLESAVERLTERNLAGCLLQEMGPSTQPTTTLALCPTGEVAAGGGGGGWDETRPKPAPTPVAGATPTPSQPITDTVEPEPTEAPPSQPLGSVLVMAFDEGEGRYDSLTSADDYVEILEGWYDVTVWSKAAGDFSEVDELYAYDLVIWTTGDFENVLGDKDMELLEPILLAQIPLIISGALYDDTTPTAVQRDIQVEDADHPMAQGFDPGQVIAFVPPPSGSEYEISVLEADDLGEEGVTSVFVRGPDSEAAGEPSILFFEEPTLGMRITMIGVPLYLLPQEAKAQLVLNTVNGLLEEAE